MLATLGPGKIETATEKMNQTPRENNETDNGRVHEAIAAGIPTSIPCVTNHPTSDRHIT